MAKLVSALCVNMIILHLLVLAMLSRHDFDRDRVKNGGREEMREWLALGNSHVIVRMAT